jgi:hypothetical protein
MISIVDMVTLMEDVSMGLWPLQIMIGSTKLCGVVMPDNGMMQYLSDIPMKYSDI